MPHHCPRGRLFAVTVVLSLLTACQPSGSSLASEEADETPTAPPGTDIFVVSRDSVDSPRNITGRPGYDNQPAFSADGKTLYYTRYESAADGAGQTDIYAITLETQAPHRAITQTVESEYSPTPMPNGNALSVVRVEIDGRQLLRSIPLDNGSVGLLLPDIEPVGYHVWLSDDQLGLFVLGEPMMLQLATVGPGPGKLLSENIGRGLQKLGDGRLGFIQHHDGMASVIATADVDSGALGERISALPDSEDFAVDPEGMIWMAQGNALYQLPPTATQWQLVVRYDAPGLQNITRIAISPDGQTLALVGDEPE